MGWVAVVNLLVGLINIAFVWTWLLPLPIHVQRLWGTNLHDPGHTDALRAAMSLGRLDGISILLTVLGVMLGFSALVGFGYVKYRSEEMARTTAIETAKMVADSVARESFKKWQESQIPDGQDVIAQSQSIDPETLRAPEISGESEFGDTK